MTLRYAILPDQRRFLLQALLARRRGIRAIEAHNGLSAIVANTACAPDSHGNPVAFDALWVSSLTSSAAQGLPDCELSSIEKRLEVIAEIAAVTHKPLIVDGDTGGEAVHLQYLCNRLEALGVSAIIVEDKRYPKRNSLSATAEHALEDPDVFADKLRRAKGSLLSDAFMVFARLESLIANQGVDDALARARTYLEAGADGIMVHSKAKTPDEVYAFLAGYDRVSDQLGFRRPVVCVPTTYSDVTDEELFRRGVDIVIHANHLLRAAHSAMRLVCETILRNDRNLEADEMCVSVPELFDLVGFTDLLSGALEDGPSRGRSRPGLGQSV